MHALERLSDNCPTNLQVTGPPGTPGEKGDKGDPGSSGREGKIGVPGTVGPMGQPVSCLLLIGSAISCHLPILLWSRP